MITFTCAVTVVVFSEETKRRRRKNLRREGNPRHGNDRHVWFNGLLGFQEKTKKNSHCPKVRNPLRTNLTLRDKLKKFREDKQSQQAPRERNNDDRHQANPTVREKLREF